MPRPKLTSHARERIAERGISEEQLYAALAHEQRRTPGQPGTIWIHGVVAGGRILKVCVRPNDNLIITAAWPDE